MSLQLDKAILHILLFLTGVFGPTVLLNAQSSTAWLEAPAPQGFLHYWSDQDYLQNNLADWESLIDLFEPSVTDSVLPIPTQRHRFPLAFAAEYVGGYFWRAISEKKLKFVGTMGREVSTYDSFIREFDLNYFPIPHLPNYIDLLLKGKAAMKQMDRGYHHAKVYSPGFPIDSVLYMDERGFLSMECENTPNLKERETLDSLFYPAVNGSKMKDHPHFGQFQTAMGFYGPFVMDCNHDCQPEIHPYDWVWWLDPSPSTLQSPTERQFLIGYLWDDSRRFRQWSRKIRHGKMAIPVCFPLDTDTLRITIEPLAHGALQSLDATPATEESFPADFVTRHWDLGQTVLQITQTQTQPKGIRYRLHPFRHDRREALAWGFLEMEVKVESHYTVRVRVEK